MSTPIIQSIVAGPFVANWQPAPYRTVAHTAPYQNLGVIGERGIREIRRFEGEDIPIDVLGLGVADTVYLGAQLFLEFELEEANRAAVMSISHPFSQPEDYNLLSNWLNTEGQMGIPGVTYTDVAGSLLLYPAYSNLTSSGAQTNPVRRYGLCTIASGFDMEKLLASRRRTVPVRLRCFPYLHNGNVVFYTKASLSAPNTPI